MLVFETELHRVESVAFSPCGKYVAAGGLGVELWDVGLERAWRWGWEKRAGDARQYVRQVEFHPSAQWVFLVVPGLNYISRLRVSDAEEIQYRLFEPGVSAIAVSPADGAVVAGSFGGVVCWPEPPPPGPDDWGARWTSAVLQNDGVPVPVACCPAGKVVSHQSPGQFVFNTLKTGARESIWPSGAHTLNRLKASPDGTYLAGSRNNEVWVWSAVGIFRHWPPRVLTNDTKKQITDFAFHPAGRHLATVSNDRGVTFWDTATWQPTKAFDWHEGRMRSLAFSPDGLVAAAGSDTGHVVLFDVDL